MKRGVLDNNIKPYISRRSDENGVRLFDTEVCSDHHVYLSEDNSCRACRDGDPKSWCERHKVWLEGDCKQCLIANTYCK